MIQMTMALDGNNLGRRMFHVGESNPDETREYYAVEEMISYIIRLNRDYQPAKVIVAWDEPPYLRNKVFPAYKANRDEPPWGWETQLHLMKKVLDLAGVTSMSNVGHEADDCLATIAAKSQNCLVVSSDKDLLQLVSPTTTVELLRWTRLEGTHRKRFTSRIAVKEFFGVFPEQIAQYKALAGDNSDNIPGVTGIGHKKAILLLELYASISGIYSNLSSIVKKDGSPLKIVDNLVEERKSAALFEELCTTQILDVEVPEAKPLSIVALSNAKNEVLQP